VQLSIILVASDPAVAQALADALGAAGHAVNVVRSPSETAAMAPGHSLVIIDRVAGPGTVGDVIASLRAGSQTAEIPILAVAQSPGVEDRIRLLEAGADDVIARPFDQPELMARIEALSLRSQEAPAGSARGIGRSQRHGLVSVFSPKGGVGTTTIATNLALIAAENRPNRVLLVDLDLSFGQVASHLNVQAKQTLLELARDEVALHDVELFRTYAIHHSSGVHILAAPPSPGYAGLITADHVDLALHRAIEAYDVVVTDAGTALDDRLMVAFGLSDIVIVPVLPEIPALNSVHLMLDQLSETGTLGAETFFVLNNVFARDLLKRSDVETALGAKITAELPYDPISYLKAVNEGVPVVRGAPKSMPAEKLRALAAMVFGNEALGIERPAEAAKKDKRGLFGRR
jgi:pilus assembly protein CpaE